MNDGPSGKSALALGPKANDGLFLARIAVDLPHLVLLACTSYNLFPLTAMPNGFDGRTEVKLRRRARKGSPDA
jgi:hypothetical protein